LIKRDSSPLLTTLGTIRPRASLSQPVRGNKEPGTQRHQKIITKPFPRYSAGYGEKSTRKSDRVKFFKMTIFKPTVSKQTRSAFPSLDLDDFHA
jgi:hypothetical protein